MAAIYYKRVIAELMSIDDVPPLWVEQVREMLNKNKNE